MSSAPPRMDYYFDELTLGQRFESAGYRFTEAAIVDFAFQFDPQPFHIDVDAAKESHFGGLIASGFHTLNIAFRMLYQTGFMRGASLGGPGMDELRWLKPVRPGDTIRAAAEVIELRPSKSKPDRGVAKFRLAALNQANEEVMTAIMMVIMKRVRE
jgi:acyl dehydratase